MAINTDLQNRVDAYRGNPGALQQKYAMNPQLLDLLALQKIKSEKEAAARDLQLKMAQQQAAQGQPPTTRDKIEQEVVGMTKQELAQQVGGLAQQRQQDQQKKMQRLLQSGVATLPAPGLARMAGGGIVAFAGEDGSFVEEDMTEEVIKRVPPRPQPKLPGDPSVYAWDRRYGATHNPDGSPKGTPPAEPKFVKDPMTGSYETAEDMRQKQVLRGELVDVPGRGLVPKAEARALEDYRQSVEPLPPTPAPARAPATAPGGLATLPGAKPVVSAPAVPPPRTPMAGAGRPSTMTDPLKMGQTEETRVTGLLGISPDERALYEKGAKDLERLYAREMDPKTQRDRELTEFLLGAANRSSFGSVMAGGAARAEAERRRNFAEQIKGLESIQKKRLEPMGIARAAIEKGIGAGQTRATLGKEMRGQEIQSMDKGLDRQVEKQKIAIQAEANAALRDQNNFQRLNTTLGAINRTIADIAQKYTKAYDKRIRDKEFQLQGAKGEDAKKLRKELDDLNAELEAVIASNVFDLRKQRESLEAAISGGIDTSGFTVRKK